MDNDNHNDIELDDLYNPSNKSTEKPRWMPIQWKWIAVIGIGALIVLLLLLIPSSSKRISSGFDEPSQPIYKYDISYSKIPMRDGVLLDVTLVTPRVMKDSSETRFPVLLEYLPYRKDDSFYLRDAQYFNYFAKRGYLVAKVDIRGTGSSSGVLPTEEYSEQELEDGELIIDYLANNLTLSNGNVGMFGISWSAFNGLMLAFRAGKTGRIPQLKAILSVDGSEDLYGNDIHYLDGVMHQDEYMASMCHENALPQSITNGDLERFLNPKDDYYSSRFEQEPWVLTYLRHQLDSNFWRNPSVMYQYDDLQIPLYLVGGLYDGYKDFALNIQQGVKSRPGLHPFVKVVIGPWEHSWPDDSYIGPTYDGRGEAVRWFDYWLKGKNTSIVSEPDLAVFVRDYNFPALETREEGVLGKWQFVESWPAGETKTFYPSAKHSLATTPPSQMERDSHKLEMRATIGSEAGTWWGDLTEDQASLDQYCLVYDIPLLTKEDEMVVIGFANVSLRTSINITGNANWIVRLEDVHPNGSVSLVTGALLNGAQRESRFSPSQLNQNEVYVLKFRLHFTTWTFLQGHSLRVSVSNALFRVIWPSPQQLTMSLYVDDPDTWIQLPVVNLEQQSSTVVPEFTKQPSFWEEEDSPADAIEYNFGGYPLSLQSTWDKKKQEERIYWVGESWWNVRDVLITAFTAQKFMASNLSPSHSEWSFRATQTYVYGVRLEEQIEYEFDFEDYPTKVGESNWLREPFLKARDELSVGLPVFQLDTNLTLSSDENKFYVVLFRSIFVNNTRIRTKQFQETIPRTFQ